MMLPELVVADRPGLAGGPCEPGLLTAKLVKNNFNYWHVDWTKSGFLHLFSQLFNYFKRDS